MDIRFGVLKDIELKTVYNVFIDAFSNYQVKLDVSFEKFSNMMKRRSVDFSVSMGIFDGNKLIGFVLNGKRILNNKLTAYDAGTGILQNYQGMKLSKQMLEENIKLLKKYNFDKYILEVIISNEKAFNLYKGFGFKVSREFNCYKKDIRSSVETEKDLNITIENICHTGVNWNEFESYFDFKISWQNSIASIEEDHSKFSFIQGRLKNKIAGYAVIESQTGDVPLLAVDSKFRNNSIGSEILNALLKRCNVPEVKVLNIPADHMNINCFLENHGFNNFIKQYEMELIF